MCVVRFPIFDLLISGLARFWRNIGLFIGVALLGQIPITALGLFMNLRMNITFNQIVEQISAGNLADAVAVATLRALGMRALSDAAILFVLTNLIMLPLMQSALINATARCRDGAACTIASAYRIAPPIYLSVFGANLLTSLILFVPLAPPVGIVTLLLMQSEQNPGFSDQTLGLIGLVLVAITILAVSWLIIGSVRLQFVIQAILLNHHGLLDSLRQSWQMTRGILWRLLFVLMVLGLLRGGATGFLTGLVMGAQFLTGPLVQFSSPELTIANHLVAMPIELGLTALQIVILTTMYEHRRAYP